VAHFGEKAMENPSCSWELKTDSGRIIAKDNFPITTIPLGNGIKLGDITIDLKGVEIAQKLTLTVKVAEFLNSWDLWVYPSVKEEIKGIDQIRIVNRLDPATLNYLEN